METPYSADNDNIRIDGGRGSPAFRTVDHETMPRITNFMGLLNQPYQNNIMTQALQTNMPITPDQLQNSARSKSSMTASNVKQ